MASTVIDCEREKKLAINIDLLLYQRGCDWKLSDFHRQHPLDVRAHIFGILGEGDSSDSLLVEWSRLESSPQLRCPIPSLLGQLPPRLMRPARAGF